MNELANKYALLKAEAAKLLEENKQLRSMLFGDVSIPWSWGLSPSQTAILRCLIARSEVPYETIEAAIYANRDRPADFKNITRVHLRNLRLKLKPRNIEIHNRSGFGYYLDPDVRSSLRREFQAKDSA